MPIRAAFRIAVLCSFPFLVATAAHAQGVQMIPAEADASNEAAWWRPLVVKGNTTYAAFNSPATDPDNHQVKVGIQVSGGAWTIGLLKDASGAVMTFEDDLGHHQPTVAVDGDGYIHVWAAHHGDDWIYFRSHAPNDVSNLRRMDMPGSPRVTYPIADHAPNGDVFVFVRNNASNAGQLELYHWNNAANTWSSAKLFARETGAYIYPDDLRVDSAGNVHVIFEWAFGTPRPLRHYGSYLKFDVAANVWRTANGTVVTTPVTRATPDLHYQGLSAGELWNNSDTGIGIQAAGLTLDHLNRPSIAYRYRTDGGSNAFDYDIYRLRWNGSAWSDKVKIYTATDNVPAAVETTHNGTRARVYFTVEGQGLMGAESPGWVVKQLAPAQSGVTRISTVRRDATTDVIYGAWPTEIDSARGRVYIFDVSSALP